MSKINLDTLSLLEKHEIGNMMRLIVNEDGPIDRTYRYFPPIETRCMIGGNPNDQLVAMEFDMRDAVKILLDLNTRLNEALQGIDGFIKQVKELNDKHRLLKAAAVYDRLNDYTWGRLEGAKEALDNLNEQMWPVCEVRHLLQEIGLK